MGVSILLLWVQFHNLFNFAPPPAAATLPPHNIGKHCLPTFLPWASTSDCGAAWSARSLKMKSYTVTPPQRLVLSQISSQSSCLLCCVDAEASRSEDMDTAMQLQAGGSQ